MRKSRYLPLICGLWMGMALSPACHAQPRIIQVYNNVAMPGASILMELRLSELQGFAGGDFSIAFDPSLVEILDINKTAITGDFLLAHGAPSVGLVTISMAAVEGLANTGPGAIATLSARVLPAVAIGAMAPITLRNAYWYNESSQRQSLLGDNGILAVGANLPEEQAVTLSVQGADSRAGETVSLNALITIPESVSQISGKLLFDANALSAPLFTPGQAVSAWQLTAVYNTGEIQFTLKGLSELKGLSPLAIGTCRFTVAPGQSPGANITVNLSTPSSKNLQDFGYLTLGSAGSIHVLESPTPTQTQTPTPTSTPPAPPTATPTPISGAIPVDFNADNRVDEKDLMILLQSWREEAN